MSLEFYTDEQIIDALQYMAALHPDIVADEESLMHYKQEVLNTGDFELGYQEFARVREALAMTVYEQQAEQQEAQRRAERTPREIQQEAAQEAAERAAKAVAVHLAEKSMGMHR